MLIRRKRGINYSYWRKNKNVSEQKKISQKSLAIKCDLSEPTIRNYELGNRTPSNRKISIIADALDISPYALSEPRLDSYEGILHVLFRLEEESGLSVYYDKAKDTCCFSFENNTLESEKFNLLLVQWCKYKEKYLTGEITKEEYETLKNSFKIE